MSLWPICEFRFINILKKEFRESLLIKQKVFCIISATGQMNRTVVPTNQFKISITICDAYHNGTISSRRIVNKLISRNVCQSRYDRLELIFTYNT